MSRKLKARIVLRQAGAIVDRARLIEYGADWKYLQVANGAESGFEATSYSDVSFSTGPAAFGTVLSGDQTSGPGMPPCVMNRTLIQTSWAIGTDMLLRKGVTVPEGTTELYFEYGADNEAYVYVEGVLVGEVHNTGQSCQTRGSTSFTYSNPPIGSVTIAVRAVDTDVAGVLQESFFDMQVDAIGQLVPEEVPAEDVNEIAGVTPTVGGGGAVQAAGCGSFEPANPANSTDGNLLNASRICNSVVSAPATVYAYWAWDLGSPKIIHRVAIATDRVSAPAYLGTGSGSINVEFSSSPSGPWSAAVSGQSWGGNTNPYWPQWHDFTFPSVVARYWRLYWTHTTAPVGGIGGFVSVNGMEMVEFQLFSQAAAVEQVIDHSGRGPGEVVAIISDAKKIGVSEGYNSPGDFFFTLPTSHPQISAVKPLETHWALEMYRSEGWKEVEQGWIVDQDPTPEETVFYGTDYLGMLARMHDERFNPDQSPDAEAFIYPEDASGVGGSYYTERRIDAIVGDQIDRAIHTTNSNLMFFERGAIASMPEQVSIYCTMEERLAFCSGLIDSHRAGTGQRTRMRHVRTPDGVYRFDVLDNPGIDRDDLTMRYGELVQGYRVVDFGDYANRALAIGKTQNDFRLEYAVSSTPAPAGQNSDYWERQFGRMTKVNFWDNIRDANDLIRRSRQYVAEAGARGKRVGLGLRVNTIGIKDGWDIGDSVPVVIQRGGLDTTGLGYNGYWTIWGWQATIDNDELDLTLTLLPKIPETEFDPNVGGSLVTDRPDSVAIHDEDPPANVSPGSSGIWINSETGHIWLVDPNTGLWYDATASGGMTGLYTGLSVADEGVTLATKALLLDFVGDGVVASGTGDTKTITIDGTPHGPAGGALAGTYPNPTLAGEAVRAAGHWEVLVDPLIVAPPDPLFTVDGDDWLYGWVE